MIFADEAADRVSALEKLVETQSKQIEALTRKVQVLEGKETTNSPGRWQLPMIMIDTNGVPLTPGPRATSVAEVELPTKSAKNLPLLSAGMDGFSMSSADTNFLLRLRGILQVDSRTFFNDNPLSEGNDGFLIRRARPILEGTIFRDIDFQIMPDFAGSSPQLYEAWLNYRYRPEVQLRAGKLRGPVGLENLLLDSQLLFNERSLVTDLVPARNLGFELWGDIADGAFSYAAGIFNGDGDGRLAPNTDFGDDKVYGARVFAYPFKTSARPWLNGFGFGIGGSYSQVSSNTLGLPATTGGIVPGYYSAGQQQFFAYDPIIGPVVADGPHWRLSPQATYFYGPFGFFFEYAISHQGVLNAATLVNEQLEHHAWQLSGMWMLTGEPASLAGITPYRSFDPVNGGWGAWQIVARYGQLDVDDKAFQGFSNPATSARGATSWTAGFNWYLSKNFRFSLSYSHTDFDGGGDFNPYDPVSFVPPATVTHQNENVLFSRLQLAF
ncbi:MAG TPA: porin [Verrucomicrobiae bacterium]|nr:porin [Verrucomicrobiae bacterium]